MCLLLLLVPLLRNYGRSSFGSLLSERNSREGRLRRLASLYGGLGRSVCGLRIVIGASEVKSGVARVRRLTSNTKCAVSFSGDTPVAVHGKGGKSANPSKSTKGSNVSNASNGSNMSNASNGSNISNASNASKGSNRGNASNGSNTSNAGNASNGSNISNASNGSNISNAGKGGKRRNSPKRGPIINVVRSPTSSRCC